jgi:dipeptidyl aminopeptidase/acylaminoacyl peptidase
MMSQLNLYRRLSLFTVLGAVLGVLLASPLLARQSLDHDVYTIWNRIEAQAISRDGHWAFWQMAPEQADGVLVVRATELDPMFTIERGSDAEFSYDSRHAVFLVKPTFEQARQAQLDKASDEEKPKADLGILTLDTGQQQRFERVQSFALPEESGQWVAFRHGVEPVAEDDEDNGVEDEEEESEDQDGRDDDQKPGTTLVVLSLESGQRHEIHQVHEYAWSADGRYLVFTRVSELGDEDGVGLFMPASGDQIMLLEGKGHYLDLVFAEDGRQLAFLGRAHDKEAPDHHYSLYHWTDGDEKARVLADESAGFWPRAGTSASIDQPSFSASGKRLFFGTAPAPVEIPDNEDKLEDEVVRVDVWHWQDERICSPCS